MKPTVIKKTKMAQVIKLQALVRGFLIRMRLRAKSKIIYNRILRMEDNFVRFTLLRDPSMLYKLSADVTLKRYLNTSTYISVLPFEEEDAAEEFEPCLRFSMNENEITELDLVGQQTNPFLADAGDQHLFITDF